MTSSAQRSTVSLVDCAGCPARTCGLCAEYGTDELHIIADYKSGDRAVRAGQDLVRLGDPCSAIYNLIYGWVFLYDLLEDGRRQILDFVMPGGVLGAYSRGSGKMTYGVQALTDAVVCVMPNKSLELLVRQRPEIGLRLAALMSQDRNLSYAHLTRMGRQSARERVAHLLLELFVRCRSQWPRRQTEQMHLPLTQQHLADATGLTGVHVSRVLGDLKQAGILKFSYHNLCILDPDRLMDTAGINPDVMSSWIRRERTAQDRQGESIVAVMPLSHVKESRAKLHQGPVSGHPESVAQLRLTCEP